MNGRRLATTERILAIHGPESGEELAALAAVADERDVGLEAVPVGESIADAYDPDVATLGVTLGGDGTYLEGVRAFAPRGVPFLGVNAGTLGFLATVSPADLPAALAEALRGEARVDERQQLRVRARGVDCTGINDVMIERVPPEDPVDRKITRLQAFVDGEYVGEYEGSGLAVATPTGSTGVSLSAGGPVHHPRDNATLQVVPLHTHRLGVRPIVVDAGAEIEVATLGPATVLVDGGRMHATLGPEEVVRVTGAEAPALVVTTSYDDPFFTSVAEKLGWAPREDRHDRGREDLLAAGDREPPGDPVARARRVAEEAARGVGPPLRELHDEAASGRGGPDAADVVPDAVSRSERVIAATIEAEFPDHGVVCGETARREGDAYVWLVSPLDGTENFARGNPNYAVSIALLEDDEPVAGAVYAPETGELFSAARGGTARRDGTPVSTTDRDRLDESTLLSGRDPDGSFLAHCHRETRGVRRLGSAALDLCFLAAGSADAVWEHDARPSAVAAGVLVARAAGARITDAGGDPYRVDPDADGRRALLGSNGPLHGPLLDRLSTMDAATPTGTD